MQQYIQGEISKNQSENEDNLKKSKELWKKLLETYHFAEK